MRDYIIDSFSLAIPENCFFEPIEKILPTKIVLIDGEIKEETYGSLDFDYKGIKTSLSVWVHPILGRFIKTVVTTKHLKQNYFDGLNSSNIHMFFRFLNDNNIFLDVNKALQNSIVSDIDIAFNLYRSRNKWAESLSSFRDYPTIRLFRKTFNNLEKNVLIGAQFVNRRDASITNPFVKFYDKFEELTNNSAEFTKNFLSRFQIANLKRIECTIKNSAHIESVSKFLPHIGLSNKLIDILNISQIELSEIFKHLVNKHLSKVESLGSKKSLNGTPQRQLIAVLIYELHRNNYYSLEDIYKLVNTLNFGRSNKASSRLKATIREALLELEENTDNAIYNGFFENMRNGESKDKLTETQEFDVKDLPAWSNK